MTPAARSERVKRWAREAGFDRAGIARAEPLREEEEFLRRWLSEGRHAEMAWLERDPARRADPTRILAGCRSVIVTACNYFPGEEPPEPGAMDAPTGRIARYARRRDYHQTLGKALRRLARRIADAAGDRGAVRWFVDTGPVLEKAWARRAGLGFIGKNTCLIDPRGGSWLLLGVALTTEDLAPDAPLTESCGACRRCIEACPTRALVAPGVLDARRCLSYLTIEHRQPFDAPAAARLQDWLFGCDLCQEACPYNRKFQGAAPEDGLPGPLALPARLPLREILEIADNETLRARFGAASPLRRAGAEGLKRTARALLEKRAAATEPPEAENQPARSNP